MVSELGQAFLRALNTYDRPVDFWDAMKVAEDTEGVDFYYSFETYIAKYLAKPGYVIRFRMPNHTKSWYMITKKGQMVIDSKRTRKQLREQVSDKVGYIFRSQTLWLGIYARGDWINRVQRNIQESWKRLEYIESILPNTHRTMIHSFVKEYAEIYVRFYDDPNDKHIVPMALDVLKTLVPMDFIRKNLKKKIVAKIQREIVSRMESGAWVRDEPDIPMRLLNLGDYFGVDIEPAVQLGTERFNAARADYLQREALRTGYPPEELLALVKVAPEWLKRCVKCGGEIHSSVAIAKATEIFQTSGMKTGVLCCRCYGKATR